MLKYHHFQRAVLKWYRQHGRSDLPWQKPITPYGVWVSEIMLQQTQVATVIPYYRRFMAQYPTLKKLAAAPIDDVLHLWTGLGYYARARNLHRAAQIICDQFSGKLPRNLDGLTSLPGIGRSTGGAILSISMKTSAPILDGNVKRVLTRFAAVEGWPGNTAVAKQLWEIAEYYTPDSDDPKILQGYTQAMMDLGATVCTRSQPKCTQCPLSKHCQSYLAGNPTAFPTRKPPKTIPVRQTYLVILENDQQQILMERRPPSGIWGGLWSLPQCAIDEDIESWCEQHYHCHIADLQFKSPFRHTFSHFHLDITPVHGRVGDWTPPMMDNPQLAWLAQAQWSKKGLAAPVKHLLIETYL